MGVTCHIPLSPPSVNKLVFFPIFLFLLPFLGRLSYVTCWIFDCAVIRKLGRASIGNAKPVNTKIIYDRAIYKNTPGTSSSYMTLMPGT